MSINNYDTAINSRWLIVLPLYLNKPQGGQVYGWELDSTSPPPNHYYVESEYHHLCNMAHIWDILA